ncbi:hypothetical protein J6TS1_38180 [Siminovitchia terrae]|uniref:Uncharacterized protein n=1 Tax=Siminovitchia terrae TaxID=1914933 RepID=A0A429X286_SIMTE|nr:hypothetical protein [Siminovitchia terrae]RST57308.1 hypothetical protein D5F11_023105 [Siminovitchia terrae]GIN89757.1 hypothetical protein J22TS1_08080 [Siminovitchia terrae]GIN97948.1 hypothetical protein J6TS1_38180 [Siminovitchia terrae]
MYYEKLTHLMFKCPCIAACTEKNDQAKDTTNADESNTPQSIEPKNNQQSEANNTEVPEKKSDVTSAEDQNQMRLGVFAPRFYRA